MVQERKEVVTVVNRVVGLQMYQIDTDAGEIECLDRYLNECNE